MTQAVFKRISRSNKSYETRGWIEFFTLNECEPTRLYPPKAPSDGFTEMEVRFYPSANNTERDFEDDRCMLGTVDFVGPVHYDLTWYPDVTITGFAIGVALSETIEKDEDGSSRYCPKPLSDYKPTLIQIELHHETT